MRKFEEIWAEVLHFIANIRPWLLDSFFPAYCLGCKGEGGFLCERCFEKFVRIEEQGCPWCYTPRRGGACCLNCVNKGFLDGVIVGRRFEEGSLLQKAIHQLKYDFVEELALPLGKFLAESLKEGLAGESLEPFVLCPLPLHPQRYRWRGFNQSELLCREVARRDGLEYKNLVKRVHFSRPQMELSREERLKNVEAAFEVLRFDSEDSSHLSRIPLEKTVLLVDDIATTLSTLNNAAKALKKAGYKRVYGLVLARVF